MGLDNLGRVNERRLEPLGWEDRLLLSLALVAHTGAWLAGTRPVALDPDAMNLAYGMERFDITHFNPHAPGYLVYVWTLRGVHLALGRGPLLSERFATVQLVSLLFALAAIVVVFVTARRLASVSGAAGWAALLVALHPILLFHAVDGQTHTSEAFASSLLLLGCVAYRRRPNVRLAAWLGASIAFGSALRPSFVLFAVPVTVWTVGLARFAHLFTAGAVSVLGAIAWIVPTVNASGGWATWRAATRGLVHHGFVLTSSPFSDTAVRSLVWANQLSLALWTAEALLPLFVAGLVASAGRARAPSELPADVDARWLAGALSIGGACTVLYYAATFISEPGYLAALLPPVALQVGMQTRGSRGVRPAMFAVMAALALWLVPELPSVLKVPSISEWRRRTERASAYAHHVEESLPPSGRHLAVVGQPDITVGRQLPMIAPRVDALLVHDGRRPWIRRTSLTYVTPDDSTPIPEAFGAPGEGAVTATSRSYDGIYFDGSLPAHFQEQLAASSSCAVPRAMDITQAVVIPIRCIPSRSIVIDGLELRFQIDGAPSR